MNKVTLIGNLTKEPDMRYTANGTAVCSFTLAVNRRYKDKDGNTVTDFFPIVAWNKLGELCGQYLAKGRKAAVVGELQSRTYEAKDGTKRYVTEIVAEEVEFLSPKGQDDGASAEPSPAPLADGFTEIVDDDLPF